VAIRRLRIQELRNLRQVELEFLRLNVLAGPNGSGKTSVLEAVYLLGSGRSFRSVRLEPVIHHSAERCVVHATVSLRGDAPASMGIARDREGAFEARLNGKSVTSTAELARTLPVQLINSDTFALLEGGPKNRRQFLDWGVFHVEHGFHAVWVDVQRSLRQRNALLRHARLVRDELDAWDRRLASSAEQLDSFRRSYFEQFRPLFAETLSELTSLEGLELSYHRGWDRERSLAEVLVEQTQRDRERGFTGSGPHRADIRVRFQGQNASEILSRGQQKLVVCALKVAQARLFQTLTGRECVFLVDDLPAELDRGHRSTLCSLLDALGCQVLISCVDAADLEDCWREPSLNELRVFHVEHGLPNPI
jgi:DNA replication and repair protein RecF